MTVIAQYRKTLAAIIGAVVTWGLTAQSDGIDGAEWWGLAAILATALGVYQAPNEPLEDSERGAVEPGSFALGIILGIVLGFLIWGTGEVR